MSDYNMLKVQSKSIYNNRDLRWQKDPFTYYYRHSIIIPEKNPRVQDMIQKHESRLA